MRSSSRNPGRVTTGPQTKWRRVTTGSSKGTWLWEGLGEGRLAPRQTHGVLSLKRAIRTLGNRVVDERTKVGKALAAWRSELLRDLGGLECISTQEAALVDAAAKTKLLLDNVDSWLLSQGTLINRKHRSVIAAVRDRNAIVNTLRGLFADLGIKRRSREVETLDSIAREYAENRSRKPKWRRFRSGPRREPPLKRA
jgi:hypothetical protein